MMTRQAEVSIAKDFSRFPAGRFVTDGPYPGETFREQLAAKLRAGKVVVILDGTLGYGSSFLEEAFGGLVRKRLFTVEQLREKLVVRGSDQSVVDEIWSYITDAKPE